MLPEITFEGVSFSDTIDFLRDVTSANVFVNWRALEAAGIDRNAPVTAKLKQVKFGRALQLMLDDVAGGKNKLAYEIDDNVITVSTAEDLGKNTVTRVYDVRDLIRPAANAPADKTADKAADPAAPAPAAAHQEKRVKILTDLIVTSVAPATWRETRGGSSGAIRELQGQLIITQTQENQIAIMNLIGGLRDLMNIERGLPTSDPPAEFPLLRQSKP